MGKHNDSLGEIIADTENGPGIDVSDHAQHVRCLGLLLHCCDISNPGKEWSIYRAWTDKVMQEFNEEYKEETASGLPLEHTITQFPEGLSRLCGETAI
jgi:hypothetical protein